MVKLLKCNLVSQDALIGEWDIVPYVTVERSDQISSGEFNCNLHDTG